MRRRISCFRLLCWRGEPRRVGSSRPQSRSINERFYCLLRNLNDPIRRHRADSSAINPVSRHLTCPRHWTMFNSIYVSHPWWSRNDCFTFLCRFSISIRLISFYIICLILSPIFPLRFRRVYRFRCNCSARNRCRMCRNRCVSWAAV